MFTTVVMLGVTLVKSVAKPVAGIAGTGVAVDTLCGSVTGFQPSQKLGMIRDNYITYEQFETEGKYKVFKVKNYNFDKHSKVF